MQIRQDLTPSYELTLIHVELPGLGQAVVTQRVVVDVALRHVVEVVLGDPQRRVLADGADDATGWPCGCRSCS